MEYTYVISTQIKKHNISNTAQVSWSLFQSQSALPKVKYPPGFWDDTHESLAEPLTLHSLSA